MTIATQLIDWAFDLTLEAVPSATRHAAVRHLSDGLGLAVAAARDGVVEPALTVAGQLGGPAQATVIGTGQRVATPAAALANGALVHGLDYDDTHPAALIHPTAVTLPAALAVGEEQGASGAEFLTAAIAGYETSVRLGAAVHHGFHHRGFHATPVVGVFGAALTAARLLGLTRHAAIAALGIAGSQAAGSLEFLATGSATKQLHPGLASQAGILAARLAGAGARGPASILEGAAGLYRLYADAAVSPAAVLDGLGDSWLLTDTAIKPYPACQLSHASLDAAASIRDELPEPADIVSILVDLPTDSVPIVAGPSALASDGPRTVYDAKFSLPWCLAVLLLDGTLDVASFDVDGLPRPDARALASRVEVRATPWDGPVAAAPGRVEIVTAAGKRHRGEVIASRGSSERPLTDDEVRTKLAANLGTREQGTDPSGAEALFTSVTDLADAPSLDALLERLPRRADRTARGSRPPSISCW